MKLPRFYVGDVHDKWGPLQLDYGVWVNDRPLVDQWLKTDKLKTDSQLILFNDETERIYQIDKIESPYSVHLKLVAEEAIKNPNHNIHLFWPLLGDGEDEKILQKAAELGVRNFVPILTDKNGEPNFDINYAHQIVVKAAEQSGWIFVPTVREPIALDLVFDEYNDLPIYLCKTGNESLDNFDQKDKIGVLIEPKVGWSEQENTILATNHLPFLYVDNTKYDADFVILAVTKILSSKKL